MYMQYFILDKENVKKTTVNKVIIDKLFLITNLKTITLFEFN